MVAVGQMRHKIQLVQFDKEEDEAGGHDETPVPWCTLRGYFRKKSGFRNFEEALDQLVQEYEAVIPWRKSLEDGINKDTRMVYDGKMFKIISHEKVDEEKHLMRFTLISAE